MPDPISGYSPFLPPPPLGVFLIRKGRLIFLGGWKEAGKKELRMKRKQGSGQRQYKKEKNSMDRGRLEGGKKKRKKRRKKEDGKRMKESRWRTKGTFHRRTKG